MSSGKQFAAMLLTMVLVFLAACAPKAAPSPVPKPTAQVPTPVAAPAPAPLTSVVPARPAWEIEWDKTVAAAKKEGPVVLYTSIGGEPRRMITQAFESKYGVDVESVTGVAPTLAPKILAEQRAGIYSGDVWISGSSTHLVLKDLIDTMDPMLILPDLTDPEVVKKTWYFGELSYANKAHTMFIACMLFNQAVSTNTNVVKPGEISTYRDLLNPKWKGKISLQDPRISTMGLMWFGVRLELGDLDVNFMRDLGTKQELFITRDARLQVEWLAQGKHAIAIGPLSTAIAEFIRLGAPVNRVNLGTPFVSGGVSGIAVLKRPPHLNAAKLFVNWLLSQEGQTVHSQAVASQSQRLDVPTGHLEPSAVLKPGLKLFRADNEEFINKRDTYYMNLAKEVFP